MIARISRALDLFIAVFKWPLAVLSLALLPFVVVALVKLIGRVAETPLPIVWVLLGGTVYGLLWHLVLRRPALGSLFPTLEHEATHVLFALLTLHPITAFHATWRRGGSMEYHGLGNWLIRIAPYFFPTISVVVIVVSLALPEASAPWIGGLLGATLCYHVISTWRETHRDQPDLKRVGFLFSFLFLPGANLLCYGAVLAYAGGRSAGLGRFFGEVFGLVEGLVHGA